MTFKITIISPSGKNSYTYYDERKIHNIEDTFLELRKIANNRADRLLPYSAGKDRGKLSIHIEQIEGRN